MRLAIIGASELGNLIAAHAINDSLCEVVGFYDDYKVESSFARLKVLGRINNIIGDYEKKLFDAVIMGIGYNQMNARAAVFNSLKGVVPFKSVIHSSAYIDKTCEIGEGVFILPGVTLDFEVVIGDNVLINTGAIIAHHTIIGKHSFIAPGVKIAGRVTVEDRCFIGIGAIVKDCITIKNRSIVGAGSLVLKDTLENSTSIGAPARTIE